MKEPNFLESVSRNFDKAAGLTDLPKGLLAQIKACNSVYQMRFPVRVGKDYQVIEAYRVQHSHHRLPTKGGIYRVNVALIKGVSLLIMGLWVLGSTVYRVFAMDVPQAEVMGIIGFMALLVNLTSVLILVRYKDGDANVRSVWLCSRNDAIGNVAVMLAAVGVWGTASGWPDLIVAAIMAGLFLSSSVQIIKQALQERAHLTGDKQHG